MPSGLLFTPPRYSWPSRTNLPALGPTASVDPPKAASYRSESRRYDCLTAVAPDFYRFERSPCLGHRCGVFPYSCGNGSNPLPTRSGKLATIVLLAVLLASCAGSPRSQLSALDDGPTRRCTPAPCVSARRSLPMSIEGRSNLFLGGNEHERVATKPVEWSRCYSHT